MPDPAERERILQRARQDVAQWLQGLGINSTNIEEIAAQDREVGRMLAEVEQALNQVTGTVGDAETPPMARQQGQTPTPPLQQSATRVVPRTREEAVAAIARVAPRLSSSERDALLTMWESKHVV